jgi:ribonuclease E
MREEPRPGDAYAWSWPARPVGDDPYQWRGPVPAQLAAAPAAVAELASVQSGVAEASFAPPVAAPTPIFEVDSDIQPPVDDTAAAVDVWVELPATEEPTRKPRARRGRGKAAAAESVTAEPVTVEAVGDTVLEPAPEPVTAEAAPEPVAIAETPAVAASHEEVAVAEAPPLVNEPPPAPRQVDANEIVAPPATPKRGWWRRGA